MKRETKSVLEELAERNPVRIEDVAGLCDAGETVETLHRIIATPQNLALVPPPRQRQTGRAQRRAAALAGLSVAAATALFATVVLPGSPTRPSTAAAAVLEQAAVAAADEPLGPMPGPGQFLYVRTLESATDGSGVRYKEGARDSWTYQTSDTKQEWIAPDGSGRELVSDGSVAFLTPKDQSAWAASGQPMSTVNATNVTYPAGSLAFPDSANLPRDPSALEQTIVQRYENGQPQEIATFTLAGTLLQEGASPALRASLFRMIEQLPGIVALGPMTDRLGRTGVGVGFTLDGVREELIFDPSTAAVLEEERVVVSASPLDISPVTPAGLARGTVVGYTVYVRTGIANSNSTLPPGGEQ